ncbi:Inosine-5'-monophosphate dehydrogenase [bioreactor metagenome]|uniref:Inosine-5'-monophosphate dehydrogenase n=1 Tax=bioreactor metagenome TaxID=1076179 RepID=A0A645C1D9_9ZZZZ|nr:CBS and ACT domain-containing protein [Erysipelotrichaceae bacterium]
MYVRDRMSKNIVTVAKDVKITQVLDIFASNNFHRLPIVDAQGKLIGLITEGTIQANTPSKATSLSIHELNYLLSKTTVESIMIKKVIIITPDRLLEEAAEVMMKHDISCLPVVEADNHLVGIITQKDVFAAFVDLLGYHDIGSRIVIEIAEDKVGLLAKIAHILAEAGVSISHLVVYRKATVDVVIRVANLDGDKIAKLLTDHGYKVVNVLVNRQIN